MTGRRRRSHSRRHGRSRPGGRARVVQRIGAAGGGLVAVAAVLPGSAAQATGTPSVEVNTLVDPATPSPAIQSHESLADAIDHLDQVTGGGTITFRSGLSGTIRLTTPLPAITQPIYIDGPGATTLRVDGGGAAVDHPVIQIASGIGTSTISGLTVSDGSAANGGGIYALSAVDLYRDVVTGNRASISGGGLSVANGSAVVEASTFAGNQATTGGAIHTSDGTDSGASLLLLDSTISGNTSTHGFGNVDVQSSLSAASDTVAGNTSDGVGGGIYARSGGFIEDSTIVGNRAVGSTGGGVFLETTASQLTLLNSIVADNSATVDPDIYNATATSRVSFSLLGDAADTHNPLTFSGFNLRGTAGRRAQPKLGPLAGNGGPTKTMLPLRGSPVINTGSSNGASYDQRGYGRPVTIPGVRTSPGGDGADIGAVELQEGGPSAVAVRGNLRLRLSLPLSSCLSKFDTLPASLDAGRIRHSKATRTRFGSASFYIDPGTVAGQRPNSLTKRAHSRPQLPLAGYSPGEHTLRAIVTVSHRHHRHIVRRKVSLELHFSVCRLLLS